MTPTPDTTLAELDAALQTLDARLLHGIRREDVVSITLAGRGPMHGIEATGEGRSLAEALEDAFATYEAVVLAQDDALAELEQDAYEDDGEDAFLHATEDRA